jgi:hypothetical protein
VRKLIQIIFIALVFHGFISCKRDKILTGPSVKLNFSQPNIMFDTVFTKIGSTTQIFRVHNNNNGEINISSIRLARGTASFYRLNVDGVPGTPGKVFTNIQVAAKDSLYIFVEVTINPNYDPITSPFIYKDSIIFELNGNTQYFDLIAFGQNAYYHMPNQTLIVTSTQAIYYDTLPVKLYGTDTFKNDKPHLIYGYLLVDSLQTLYIEPGTKIYVHNAGGIWVYRYGTINIAGTSASPVTFQGDRLEQAYQDVPGQWDRIWINEGSTKNTIDHAVIKNAYIGVHAGYSVFDGLELPWADGSDHKRLTLTNTIIQNCSYAGLLGHFYNITGGNDVIVNCGSHLVEFDFGGNYSFYQCTFANYWDQTNNSTTPSARTTPSFLFNNYYNGNTLAQFDTLMFGNCIFDGTMAEEFQFDTITGGFMDRSVFAFNYCALKTGILHVNTTPTNNCEIITGTSNLMRFDNTSNYNFDISVNPPYSAAYQAGLQMYNGGYFTDINGNPFINGGNPNMGAYAK